MSEGQLQAVLQRSGYVACDAKALSWALRLKHAGAIFAHLDGLSAAHYRTGAGAGDPNLEPSDRNDEAAAVAVQQLRERLVVAREKRQRLEAQSRVLGEEVARRTERRAQRRRREEEATSLVAAAPVAGLNETVNAQLAGLVRLTRSLAAAHGRPSLLGLSPLERYVAAEQQGSLGLRRATEQCFAVREVPGRRAGLEDELARLEDAFVTSGWARVGATVAVQTARATASSEAPMEVALLQRRATAAVAALRGALEEAAKARTMRVLLADVEAALAAAQGRAARAQALLGQAEAQAERLGRAVAILRSETAGVRHAATLLRALAELLVKEAETHNRNMTFWATVEARRSQPRPPEGRWLDEAVGDGSRLAAALGGRPLVEVAATAARRRDEAMRSSRALSEAVAAATGGPPVDAALGGRIQDVSELLANATRLLCQVEKDRATHEAYLRAGGVERAAVERSLMVLFWDNPKNPTKLNHALTALTDKK